MSYLIDNASSVYVIQRGGRNLIVADDNTKFFCALRNTGSGQTVCMYRSDDAGQTWTPFEAGSITGLYQHVAIAADSTGLIHAIILSSGLSIQVWYRTFSPSTNTWSAESLIVTTSGGASGRQHVDVAIGADDLPQMVVCEYVTSRTASTYNIHYRKYNGAIWAMTTISTPNVNAYFPRIIIAEPFTGAGIFPVICYAEEVTPLSMSLFCAYYNSGFGVVKTGALDTLGLFSNDSRDWTSLAKVVSGVRDNIHISYFTSTIFRHIWHSAPAAWGTWQTPETIAFAVAPTQFLTTDGLDLKLWRQNAGSVLLYTKLLGGSWDAGVTVHSGANANVRGHWAANHARRLGHHLDFVFRDGSSYRYGKLPLNGARRTLTENLSSRAFT